MSPSLEVLGGTHLHHRRGCHEELTGEVVRGNVSEKREELFSRTQVVHRCVLRMAALLFRGHTSAFDNPGPVRVFHQAVWVN